MNLFVYALVPSRTIIREKGLRLVVCGAIAAVVTDGRRPRAVTRRNLLEYDRAMRNLARSASAIVPARFNTRVDSEASLVALLRAREASLRHRLAHVRNRVQMTVRIPSEPPQVSARPAPGGQAYLRDRARALRVQELELLRPAVQRWVRDERVERRGRLASVYHLVPRSSAASYRQALLLAALARRQRVRISGPFPPYAFAGDW